MTGFHDVRFPEHISYGSGGGPMFSTTIMALNSGFERRNINWATVRAAYEAMHGIKSREQMEELINFFYARMGRAYSFRYKDWSDYEIGPQIIGTGDGSTEDFQLIKTYESGGFAYDRLISKPVEGTLVNVAVANAIAASTILLLGGNADNLDTITIGSRTYTFVAGSPANDDEIEIGANVNATRTNLRNAINLGPVAGGEANSQVTAVNGGAGELVLTAITLGSSGNSIATTAASANLSFPSATLTGGEEAGVTPVLQIEDVDFTVNYSTGVLTFVNAPTSGAPVTIGGCEFDVHARFDSDHLNIVHDMWETMSWPSIPIVEVKELV